MVGSGFVAYKDKKAVGGGQNKFRPNFGLIWSEHFESNLLTYSAIFKLPCT
jgi:hypothetical protein